MIRVITFDLDDTLWDVRPALIRAEAAQWQWLETKFPDVLDRNDVESQRTLRRQLLTDSPELMHHISEFRQRFIERLLLAAGIEAAVAEDAAAAAFAAFLEERHQVEIYTHALPVLQTLSERYMLGALTNGNAEVRKTPLGHLFSFVFRAEEVGASKPAPDLFAAAAAAANADPGEMVHVGDHLEHDVAGARAFGARTIWFNPEGQNDPSADLSVSCLTDLPEAIERLSKSRPS